MNKFDLLHMRFSGSFAYAFIHQDELSCYEGLATYCAMSL